MTNKKTQIMTMLHLQDEMNSLVDADWREKKREWYRAIWVECAEMLDHYGWKWWKMQQADMPQVHLELVDVWHFGMSLLIEQTDNYNQAADIVLDDITHNQPCDADFPTTLEQFTASILVTKQFSPKYFFKVMDKVDLSFDQLFTMYVGKNVLNIFRQEHGYKDGTYVKAWGGREDNEYLVDAMNALDASDPDYPSNILNHLEIMYLQ